MRGVIIAGGIIENPAFIQGHIREGDFIICLDSGLNYLYEINMVPDIITGDFDSVDLNILDRYRRKGVEIHEFPSRKDYTDMEIGLKIAIRQGIDELMIMGALGGRLDHTLGNLDNMIQALEKGIDVCILDEKQHVFLLRKGRSFRYKKGTVVSLIPLTSQVEGVETFNLSYPLNHETLFRGYSRGISNIFDEEEAAIAFKSGILFVIVNL